ncbi:MAG TPA: GntR family transcriptional regulator [Anaerolineaceae bacterium]|nr:GntR family transcriptional regulator [Anaerolineaceae bacterium]
MELQRIIPLNEQIKKILLDRIQCGTYAAGMRFPSEAELCLEFGVSRATVRTVLAELSARGLLVRQAGVGTFLAGTRQLETGLEQLESVLSIARRHGLAPAVDGLEAVVLPAPPGLAERLDRPGGAPLTRITRAIRIADQPVSYHEDYVPTEILAPEQLEPFTGSVLDLLTDRLGLSVTSALTEITAVNASGPLCASLGVAAGCALILLKETLHDEAGAAIGFSDNYFVPDRFRLQFLRRK